MRSPSSTSPHARSSERWSAPACPPGRRRSCPTIVRCSPAAATISCAAGTRLTGERIGEADAGTPGDPLAAYGNDPGAHVFRACVACHTLKPDEPPRAGPTLVGIFGRRIATQPGYDFSPALKQLDIVWTPETVSKLFEVGPAAYTPGTKMPEQKVGAEDRAALVKFLEKATRP